MGQHNSRYFAFVACEFLNLSAVIVNFIITNKFLNGKFASYGQDVLRYINYDKIEVQQKINPMCNAFPTTVSSKESGNLLKTLVFHKTRVTHKVSRPFSHEQGIGKF